MFDNIGGKIKTLAKVVCWIGIIVCIITGIVLMATDKGLVLAGILTAVLGSILSWVSSFVLYGFGQLVENSDSIVQQNRTYNTNLCKYFDTTSNIKQVTVSPTESQHKWRCASCGKMISSNPCPYCGSDNNANKLETNICLDKTANKLETSNPDKIVCSLCGFEQPSYRVYCWHCSTKFENSDH